jgi:hypothetical protein
MAKILCVNLALLLFLLNPIIAQQGQLKFIIYDFDGLNTGETNLPDGDFRLDDLSYKVVPNPLGFSDMLGDRSLELNLNWNKGRGDFGKGISRYFELDVQTDYFNFYLYNPLSNTAAAIVEISLAEDDDGDDVFDPSKDDIWKKEIIISRASNWQLISIPLKDFIDSNIGGNGLFDAGFTGNGGMLFQFSIRFKKPEPNSISDTYYLDMINFSEGLMPHGKTILNVPEVIHTHGCRIGAYTKSAETDMNKTPDEIENLFPLDPAKKIKFVNTFFLFSTDGQEIPNKIPRNDVKNLLNRGYTPVITWEPLFLHLPRLHPNQPRLQNIINGDYDDYIYEYGLKLAEFNDTIIIRLMHEFEGNWYPWSIVENGKDPEIFIQAYRKMVDIVRSAGASKVKWMWCLNSLPAPSRRFNWVVAAYPGDDYVDIVATDIYNHPDLGVPYWNSFRYTGIETYYYLSKYFPQKPLYICEVGVRERYDSEPKDSQSKSEWLIQMDKDLKSFFHKTEALILFNAEKEHNWMVQSSPETLKNFQEKFWNDDYYFTGDKTSISETVQPRLLNVFPNPSAESFTLLNTEKENISIKLFSIDGKCIYKNQLNAGQSLIFGAEIPSGMFFLNISNGNVNHTQKLVKW